MKHDCFLLSKAHIFLAEYEIDKMNQIRKLTKIYQSSLCGKSLMDGDIFSNSVVLPSVKYAGVYIQYFDRDMELCKECPDFRKDRYNVLKSEKGFCEVCEIYFKWNKHILQEQVLIFSKLKNPIK